VTGSFGEKQASITGIGQTVLYRKPTVFPFQLAVEACERAIADAGLQASDIDGIAGYPLGMTGVGTGLGAASPADIQASLGLSVKWHGSGENAAQYSPILNAIAAIAAGYCRHVLVWRALGERWIPTYSHAYKDTSKPIPPSTGWKSWWEPYWAGAASIRAGVHASAHMNRFGITREQMSAVPLAQRRNAALNPIALYQEPLSFDDYMGARMISTPFCLYDCDVPCDGATAMVISRIDLAKDMPHKIVRFEAVGGGARQGIDRWIGRNDFPRMMMHDAADMMWSRTDMTPKDVDVAHLYDGFTYFVLLWLEALGFCKEGESGAFVEGGTRIALDGELPINTNGGQLSEGRTHGFGHLHEAVLQLRGAAGARQVANARVAVSGVGGGALGGCLLITNQN
jgi:acetyl-CoA acetyltransferase